MAVASFWLLLPKGENSRIMPNSQTIGGNVEEEMTGSSSDSEGFARNNPEIGMMPFMPISA